MQEIIKELMSKISSETTKTITSEMQFYIAGLADALEVVRKRINDKLVPGNEYYVLMPVGETRGRPTAQNEFRPLKMFLYQIKIKKSGREIYCFSVAEETDWFCGSDLIQFSNPTTLKLRVFKSKEEAEKHKDTKLWTFRKYY